MIWVWRRLVLPFLVGGTVCTVILLLIVMGSEAARPTFADLKLAALLVLPFEALGLILLVPIALALRNQSLPRWMLATLVVLIGSALGVVIVLPISDGTPIQAFSLPATLGAASAAIWFALNREVMRD
jgi:NAD/NADP transhydrogenase beta subunit